MTTEFISSKSSSSKRRRRSARRWPIPLVPCNEFSIHLLFYAESVGNRSFRAKEEYELCPHGGLVNPENAFRCDCGYNFQTAVVETSLNAQAVRQRGGCGARESASVNAASTRLQAIALFLSALGPRKLQMTFRQSGAGATSLLVFCLALLLNGVFLVISASVALIFLFVVIVSISFLGDSRETWQTSVPSW